MIIPQDQFCTKVAGYTRVIFDIRKSGAADRVHRKRATWQEQCEIEAIDKDHFLLLMYAESARRSV